MMKASVFPRLSILMTVMYLQTQCIAGNRWTFRPNPTTAVKEGSNVTLTWLYVLSNDIKPERITFGLWKSSQGYIETKLILVKRSGLEVNPSVKGRMFFEGTLSNPGKATIKILGVSLQDSKAYGIEISIGLHRSPFEHSFELLVYTSPTSPRIVFQETINRSFLRLSWQQPKTHSHPMYTVWIRKNQSRWRISNTTLREAIVSLWGEGRYEFGVTAWNQWAQSPLQLEANNTVTITRPTTAPVNRLRVETATKQKPHQDVPRKDTQTTHRPTNKTDSWHETYQTSTPPPTTSNKKKNKTQGSIQGFFEKFMTHILILIVVTVLVVCGICLCVAVLRCRRKRNQGKISGSKKRKANKEQRTSWARSQMMYKEASTLTLDKEFELTEVLTPFAKFEVPCTLHDDVPPTMKTFGHRNNSSNSSTTNQDPSDEGGVHIYQEVEGESGPALPPRNSIKKKQQSLNRNKFSNNEKNTRSSKKRCTEESTHDEVCSTIEKVPNKQRKRTAKKGEKMTEQKGCQDESCPIYDNYQPRVASKRSSKSTSSSTSVPYSESDWEVTPRSVYLCRRIGAGSFGQVWKGMLNGKYVAVKMLNESATRSDEKDLLSELEVMKTLKPHPNVVKLQGCITKESVTSNGSVFYPPLVFLELVPYGDLLGYLRKSRGEEDDYYSGKDLKCPKRLTPQHLFSFANDVAKGMAFLAENKIVHRDLAARNVLIGDKLRCKITDFGMARTLHNEDIYTKKSNGLFPVKWMAIESLLFQKYTTYSDVWSYGVVLYEIFTLGGRPYVGMNGREVVEMIKRGKRLPRPPHVYSKLYSLMLQCWSNNPNHRPDFASLCKRVPNLAKDHQKYLNLKEYDHRLYVNVSTLNET